MTDRKLFDAATAEAMKALPARSPYRPSNGTEGEVFYENWCADCRCDAAFRADPDNARGCPIWACSMAFRVDDESYPRELYIDGDGQPRCAAHQPEASAHG
jgi:hypothetical protein